MRLKSAIVSALLAILSNTPQTGLAASAIPCPTATQVSQSSQKIDDALPDGYSYIVSTSQPAFTANNHAWIIRTEVPARSQQDAIKLAQVTVKQTSALLTPNAIPVLHRYSCAYFSARAFVYTLTS
ncbi:unnamed protein product [Sphagnum balticum]